MFNNDKFMASAMKIYGRNQYKDCFAKTYKICELTSPITQLIGAALASFYLFEKVGLALLPNGHQYQLSVAVGTVAFALFSLELTKRICVLWSFRQVYKRLMLFRPLRWPYLTASGAMICMALSVLTSAYGARLYTSMLKDESPQIEQEYSKKADLIKASFTKDIGHKKAIVYALEERGRKRRWGLTDNETHTLTLANDAVSKLRHERKNALFQLEQNRNKALENAKAKLNTSLVPVVTFALCLELLTVSCLGYGEYFKARIYRENLPVTKTRERLLQKYPKLTKDLVKRKRSRRPISVKELSHIHSVGQSTIHRLKQELSL